MRKPKRAKRWYFVDEAGDPTFYSKNGHLIVGEDGCSPILILGFIETENPRAIRKELQALQNEIVNDAYFAEIPSVQKHTAEAFHAAKDIPEIRYLVYKRLAAMEFKAQLVVARKLEHIFREDFQSDENKLYDYLVSCLFEKVMHRYSKNTIYFAKRGSRARQRPLVNAIKKGIERFERKLNTVVRTDIEVYAQTPASESCLSVVDYVNWALYRAYTRGEMRYYETISDRVSLVVDLYDEQKRPKNLYDRRRRFHINKITPLQLGPQ